MIWDPESINAVLSPTARQKRPRQNEPSQTMSLILRARFLLSNQRLCRWLVAGKDRGEKGRLGSGWCMLHLNSGNRLI